MLSYDTISAQQFPNHINLQHRTTNQEIVQWKSSNALSYLQSKKWHIEESMQILQPKAILERGF